MSVGAEVVEPDKGSGSGSGLEYYADEPETVRRLWPLTEEAKLGSTNCPWRGGYNSNEYDVLVCMDNTRCNADREGWDCCASRGGRKLCPANYPLMCASATCGPFPGNEYCCSTRQANCSAKGGERPCPTPPQNPCRNKDCGDQCGGIIPGTQNMWCGRSGECDQTVPPMGPGYDHCRADEDPCQQMNCGDQCGGIIPGTQNMWCGRNGKCDQTERMMGPGFNHCTEVDCPPGCATYVDGVKRCMTGCTPHVGGEANSRGSSDSGNGLLGASKPELGHSYCPWKGGNNSGQNNVLVCMDNSRCDAGRWGWDCCAGRHGGRKLCPANYPLMCASQTCSGDYCCSTWSAYCSAKGGERPCSQPTPPPPSNPCRHMSCGDQCGGFIPGTQNLWCGPSGYCDQTDRPQYNVCHPNEDPCRYKSCGDQCGGIIPGTRNMWCGRSGKCDQTQQMFGPGFNHCRVPVVDCPPGCATYINGIKHCMVGCTPHVGSSGGASNDNVGGSNNGGLLGSANPDDSLDVDSTENDSPDGDDDDDESQDGLRGSMRKPKNPCKFKSCGDQCGGIIPGTQNMWCGRSGKCNQSERPSVNHCTKEKNPCKNKSCGDQCGGIIPGTQNMWCGRSGKCDQTERMMGPGFNHCKEVNCPPGCATYVDGVKQCKMGCTPHVGEESPELTRKPKNPCKNKSCGDQCGGFIPGTKNMWCGRSGKCDQSERMMGPGFNHCKEVDCPPGCATYVDGVKKCKTGCTPHVGGETKGDSDNHTDGLLGAINYLDSANVKTRPDVELGFTRTSCRFRSCGDRCGGFTPGTQDMYCTKLLGGYGLGCSEGLPRCDPVTPGTCPWYCKRFSWSDFQFYCVGGCGGTSPYRSGGGLGKSNPDGIPPAPRGGPQ